MGLREKVKNPGAQLQIGLIFLGFASLSRWFLQPPHFILSEDFSDGITGLFYGISIGFMLLGIWRRNHGHTLDK